MTAPSSDGSYMICVTAGSVQATAPTAILRWTDENGQFRNYVFLAANGVPNGCTLVRNAGGTAPTIETDGTYSGRQTKSTFGMCNGSSRVL